MRAPDVFSGEPVTLDQNIRRELESYLRDACGEYGHMAMTQALGLAASQTGDVRVSANIGPGLAELTIKTDRPNLVIDRGAVNWAMLDALMRRGAVRIRQHWSGTTIHVRVRVMSPVPASV